MNTILKTTVNERINNGYKFELGTYISEGFAIFQKEWILFCLYGLVSLVLLVGSFFTIFGFAFLLFPTMLGFSCAADKVGRGETLQFNDFFGGYKNFSRHFVVGLLVLAAYVLLFVPYIFLIFFATQPDTEDPTLPMLLAFLSLGLMIIGVYFLQVVLFFTPYLIHYGDYSAGEAMKKSYALAMKNFWWMLLFVFVVGIITGIGQYICLVGMFATVPVGFLINYALVKNVLLSSDASEIDEIGKISY